MASNSGFGTQLVPYDFDGNGTTDILFSRTAPVNGVPNGNEYRVWTLNGLSILDQAVIGGNEPAWSLPTFADFDGNGTTDLLFRRSIAGPATEYGVWTLNGTQVTGQAIIGTAVPGWVALNSAFGDFDGNGSADLLFQRLTTAGGASVYEYGIWLTNGTGASSQVVIGATNSSEWSLVDSGRFDSNATSDLLFARPATDLGGDVAYGIWTLDGTQITGQRTIGFSGTGWGAYKFIKDFNGDGTLDLLFERAVGGGTEYGVWTLDGIQAPTQKSIGIAGPGWEAVVAEDFSGDGATDLLFQRKITTGYEFAVWTLNGTQVTGQAVIGSIGADWKSVTFTNTRGDGDYNDFNGDGSFDLLFTKEVYNNGTLVGYEYGLWLLDGTNVLSQKVIGTSGAAWRLDGGADINGDGIADLTFINTSTAQYAAWTLGADGSVTGQAVLGTFDDVNAPAGWTPITDFYFTP